MSETTALARCTQLTCSQALETGKVLAQSGFFPEAKDAARAAAKIMLGQELGLPPMSSMKNIYVLDNKGKPTFQLAAGTQLALVRQSGRYDYKVLERSAQRARIRFVRYEYDASGKRTLLDSDEVEYSLEDAAVAGALDKPTYKAHPKNMLFWRCVSAGVSAFCPDVLFGTFYSEGEIDGGLQSEEPSEATTVEARVVSSEPLFAVELSRKPKESLAKSEPPAAAPAVQPAQISSADTVTEEAQPSPAVSSTESLDRTAAGAGIKAGDGPLAPDGPESDDERVIASLIPILHGRSLVQRLLGMKNEDVVSALDLKDINAYLKELCPGPGAKEAWKAVLGEAPKAGMKVTKAQIMNLCLSAQKN